MASVLKIDDGLNIVDAFPEDPHAGFAAARALEADAVKDIPVLILSAVNQRSNLLFGFAESDISDDFMPVEGFLKKTGGTFGPTGQGQRAFRRLTGKLI